MFEVGKQYQHSVSKRTIEVLFVGERSAFVKTRSSGASIVSASSETVEEWGGQWEPYLPPTKIGQEYTVLVTVGGGMTLLEWTPEPFAMPPGQKCIGHIRVVYIDHHDGTESFDVVTV
jgi:hypothetical protein